VDLASQLDRLPAPFSGTADATIRISLALVASSPFSSTFGSSRSRNKSHSRMVPRTVTRPSWSVQAIMRILLLLALTNGPFSVQIARTHREKTADVGGV
jgi:hypothetical protein